MINLDSIRNKEGMKRLAFALHRAYILKQWAKMEETVELKVVDLYYN